jgi:hypothetical protein
LIEINYLIPIHNPPIILAQVFKNELRDILMLRTENNHTTKEIRKAWNGRKTKTFVTVQFLLALSLTTLLIHTTSTMEAVRLTAAVMLEIVMLLIVLIALVTAHF